MNPALALQPGVLLAAVVGAGLAAGVVLLVLGIRGTASDPARPPSVAAARWARWRRAVASPAVSGRVAGAVLVGGLILVVTRWPVAAVGLAGLVFWWPRMFGGTRAEQEQIRRLEALVTWTEALRDTVAAHASLEHAIPATTHSAPPLIRSALVRLSGRIRARTPLDDALLALAAELDDASADLVIAALILNVRRRGDRLGDVLSGLATTAREELDLRRRISAGRAGLRRGVQIVIALTLAFAVFLFVFGGTYVRPYDTPAGQIALAVAVGLFAVGFTWMRHLSAAHRPPAFLRRPQGSPR
ncbi:MAG: type II secretion system F family protein [Kineosporiaceae bacterium]|nr:type II secretion system F family protein [Kineosporiaceae bacterium]